MGQVLRLLLHVRTWNIACRTAHILVTSVLFGGHLFRIEAERLIPWVYGVVLTGMVLLFIEAYPNWRYCVQARGLMVLSKIALVCMVPWLWDYRVPVLAAVIIIGCIGSHMPRPLRYYSILERRVMDSAHPPQKIH